MVRLHVKMIDDGLEFDCECGQYQHMCVLCCHMLNVWNVLTEFKLLTVRTNLASTILISADGVLANERDRSQTHYEALHKRYSSRTSDAVPERSAKKEGFHVQTLCSVHACDGIGEAR